MAEYGFGNPEVVEEELDILIIGGGMAACGAAFEVEKWAKASGAARKIKRGEKPVRSGRWQIMINGESYKWIVAEAAKKALGMDRIQERIFVVRLINDKNDPTRIAGAAGFSVREHKLYIYKFKACLLACGGAVNVFRPRSVGEGTGRAW